MTDINMDYEVLTTEQKLQALANKYYHQVIWEPKKGDYYTTSRDDLELYQIVDISDEYILTQYCTAPDSDPDAWEEDKFLKGFGENRVHVPLYILEQDVHQGESSDG